MEIETIEETQLEVQNPNEDIAPLNEQSDEDKRIKYYVLKLKLAVAIAIIRSTPQGMAPENYASYLVQAFIEDVDSWKAKCETLEREIFSLEQKLQTITLKRNANFPDIEIVEETPPLACVVRSRVELSSNLKTKISNTVEFVRSFILLGSVTNSSLEQNQKEQNRETLREVALRSISLLFEYLRSEEGLLLEYSVSNCAMEEVRRLLDSRANFFEQDLIKLSMDFVENLLRDIYKTLEINKMDFQHRRSALIQMLAENKRLTTLILSRLLREITILSDNLVSLFRPEVEDFSSLLHIENMYYVLQSTEGVLHIMRQQNSALNAIRIPKALLAEWDKTTQNTLLEIAAHFPMYSIYVWHIKALMKSVLLTELLV